MSFTLAESGQHRPQASYGSEAWSPACSILLANFIIRAEASRVEFVKSTCERATLTVFVRLLRATTSPFTTFSFARRLRI